MPPSVPPAAAPATGSPEESGERTLGYLAFIGGYFRAARGPWALGIALALVSYPLLSFLKPKIEFGGLFCVALLWLVGSLVALAAFFLQNSYAFLLSNERTMPTRAKAFFAFAGYQSFCVAMALAPLVAAEKLSPDRGLLTTLAPALRKDQAKWLGLETTDTEETLVAARPDDSAPAEHVDNGDGAESSVTATPRPEEENGIDRDSSELSEVQVDSPRGSEAVPEVDDEPGAPPRRPRSLLERLDGGDEEVYDEAKSPKNGKNSEGGTRGRTFRRLRRRKSGRRSEYGFQQRRCRGRWHDTR
jgi:hypothetical protein